MSKTEGDQIKKMSIEKNIKFEWGVPEPIYRNQVTNNQNNLQYRADDPSRVATQTNYRTKNNINGISFQDLPVKQSEIITTDRRNAIKNELNNYQRRGVREHLYTEYTELSNQNKQTLDKLSQLKNQFEILKGMMIDSKIGQTRRTSQDKIDSIYQSNANSRKNQHYHLKTGQNIRAKHQKAKPKPKNNQSSEISQNTKRSNLYDRIYTDNSAYPPSSPHSPHQKTHKQIKISRSKNDQSMHRLNPETSRSKRASSSRINMQKKLQKSSKEKDIINSTNLIEKHSLQLQLKNSLQKIQTLIQNQILLKTKNHQLQQIIRNNINRKQSKTQQKRVEQLSKKLNDYQRRYQESVQQNKRLCFKIGKIESDNAANEAIINLLKEQKNKQVSNSMNTRLHYATLQIDNKRLKMQKQLESKDYQYQIQSLRNQVQIIRKNAQYQRGSNQPNTAAFSTSLNFDRQRIKILEYQVQQKDRKYKALLQELKSKNSQSHETELLKMVEKLQTNRQTLGQTQLNKQLDKLKEQLNKIKSQSNLQLTRSQFGLESKVHSLQQAIKRDNDQKLKYLAQFENYQQEHDSLTKKYRTLQTQRQTDRLQHQQKINRIQIQLQQKEEQLRYVQQRCQQYKKQNDRLIRKAQQAQQKIRNNQQLEYQIANLRTALNKKQQKHNMEIKDAKKKIDEAEFQSYRVQEESKLNLQLNTKRLQSELQVLKNKLKSVQSDRDYYNNQSELLRQQNQILSIKLKDLELNRDTHVKYQSFAQQQQKQMLKNLHLEQIDSVSRKFMTEEQKLVQQINRLTKINEQLSGKLRQYITIQTQNIELKELNKRKISTQNSVLHLQQIKDIQYQNVNRLMELIKNFQNQNFEKFIHLNDNKQQIPVQLPIQVQQFHVNDQRNPNLNFVQQTAHHLELNQAQPIIYQNTIQQPFPIEQIVHQPIVTNIVQQPIAIQNSMHYQMIQPGIIQNMSNVPNGFSARVLKKVRALQPEELAQIQNIQPIQNQLPSPSRLMQRIPINRQNSMEKVIIKKQ